MPPETIATPEPTTPKEESAPKKSTTEKLFPDLLQPESTDEAKKETEPVKTETPTTPETNTDDFLDIGKFKGAKVKLKVDGVEEEATLDDVIRRVQTDAHITKKSQRIAEKEKEINERERAIIAAQAQDKKTPPQAKAANADDEESIFKDDPAYKRLMEQLERQASEIQELRSLGETLHAQTAESRYQSNVKALAYRVEKELGVKDFMDYEPKIRAHIQSLPPEEARKADTADAWVGLYKDFKLKDLMESKKTEAAKPPERPNVKAPRVEGGKSVSSQPGSDWKTRYDKAFERARHLSQEGHPDAREAWIEVSRLKNEES